MKTQNSQDGNDLPQWRRMLNLVCGVSSAAETPVENPDDKLSPEEKAKRAAEFLEEKAPWKK
ncbi:hypothetical protein E2C01_097607 [Portunus trituberculatus]|uniref:Uncharacterized protein n=1 Tax=Portunus trituberculatus TaxID=210409 RepID=A0A5B7JVM4_PORTR|nr:hypothetical protein [Portunus trituberculatus]